jgi:uncharacterized protein
MPIPLNAHEARVLGSLIEKSLTTPDLYPMTLNGLANACNQKSSRDPVTDLDEATIARTISSLRDKDLVFLKSESGNRAPKFGHRVENLLKGGSAKEIGAVCVLLLRGPQTPGEIKTRTERLCQFESTADVEMTLNDLAARPEGAYVARLARQPGQKETRFMHLFSGDAPPVGEPAPASAPAVSSMPSQTPASENDRLARLEQRVESLERTLRELQTRLKGLAG